MDTAHMSLWTPRAARRRAAKSAFERE